MICPYIGPMCPIIIMIYDAQYAIREIMGNFSFMNAVLGICDTSFDTSFGFMYYRILPCLGAILD